MMCADVLVLYVVNILGESDTKYKIHLLNEVFLQQEQ